jgi:signal transduction histidine kinase
MTQTRHPLANLLVAVVNSQEQEGARVARLLHDEVGQILSAVGLHLEVLRMDVEADKPEVAQRIVETQKILEKAVDQVRSLSYEMNPEVVERAGLQTAMDRLVGRYREMTPIPVRLLFDSSMRVTGTAATSIYKIAECALDNAIKHSSCSLVELFVHPTKTGISLEVKDDGGGFDTENAAAEPIGLGLPLMNCYAKQGNLKLTVKSAPGGGTIVKASSTEPAQSDPKCPTAFS